MWGTEGKGRLKLFLLLVMLAVPVIFFLFLKGFGENHYSVPVYYQHGVPSDTSDCHFEDREHVVNMMTFWDDQSQNPKRNIFDKKLSVIDIDVQSVNPSDKAGYPLNRVADHFSKESAVQFILIRTGPNINQDKQSTTNDRFIDIYVNKEKITEFARCELILLDFPDKIVPGTRRFVLVDPGGRIRGYYPESDFDEIDRMILEMKIILREELK